MTEENIVPENLISKFARKAGIRNRDDVIKIVTGESPLERKQEDLENSKRMSEVKINIFVDEGNLDSEGKRLLTDSIEFAQRTSVDFQNKMNLLMDEYRDTNPAFSESIQKKMIEKGYDLPRFSIYGGELAQQFIEEIGQGRNIYLRESDLVMVFNLPAPLARFWYRGGVGTWGSNSKDIPEENIEWGHFYRKAMPVIWHNVGYEESEGKINLDRVNEKEQHDPKKYYYVWKVSHQIRRNRD